MTIRHGINFPAWFNPDWPPSAPIKPIKPEKVFLEKKEVFVKNIYLNGSSVKEIINTLDPYDYKDYIIVYGDDCISINKIEYNETVMDDKDYDKKLKDFERKIKEYEKSVAERQLRLNKYPELKLRYLDAKYRDEIIQIEDLMVEKQIEFGILENEIRTMKLRTLELNRLLKEING